MNAITLRSCPFCGGAAAIITTQGVWERVPKFFVACTKCGVETPRTSRSRQEAAARWNQRPKPKGITAKQEEPPNIYEKEFNRLMGLPNCNDCGVKQSGHTYPGCPKLGEDIRINCPLWTPRMEAKP